MNAVTKGQPAEPAPPSPDSLWRHFEQLISRRWPNHRVRLEEMQAMTRDRWVVVYTIAPRPPESGEASPIERWRDNDNELWRFALLTPSMVVLDAFY